MLILMRSHMVPQSCCVGAQKQWLGPLLPGSWALRCHMGRWPQRPLPEGALGAGWSQLPCAQPLKGVPFTQHTSQLGSWGGGEEWVLSPGWPHLCPQTLALPKFPSQLVEDSPACKTQTRDLSSGA